jgi:aminodeoxychorismate lyase
MIVFLNGQFVPEDRAQVSVFDRGFLYGDGLFETLRVLNGKPFRWQQHMERLRQGLQFMNLISPFDEADLCGFAKELIARNEMPDSLLRLTLSRGVGPRGYSPKGADSPTVVMSLHPAPAPGQDQPLRWKLVTSSVRLPANEPLALFKNCNKLPQILARSEADASGAQEALLLNTDGYVVEATSSNFFWAEEGTICTPPLVSGILPGVTRAVIFELCQKLGLPTREANIRPERLLHTQGLFVSLSSFGICAGASLDGRELPQSPLVPKLHAAYWDLVSC